MAQDSPKTSSGCYSTILFWLFVAGMVWGFYHLMMRFEAKAKQTHDGPVETVKTLEP